MLFHDRFYLFNFDLNPVLRNVFENEENFSDFWNFHLKIQTWTNFRGLGSISWVGDIRAKVGYGDGGGFCYRTSLWGMIYILSLMNYSWVIDYDS